MTTWTLTQMKTERKRARRELAELRKLAEEARQEGLTERAAAFDKEAEEISKHFDFDQRHPA